MRAKEIKTERAELPFNREKRNRNLLVPLAAKFKPIQNNETRKKQPIANNLNKKLRFQNSKAKIEIQSLICGQWTNCGSPTTWPQNIKHWPPIPQTTIPLPNFLRNGIGKKAKKQFSPFLNHKALAAANYQSQATDHESPRSLLVWPARKRWRPQLTIYETLAICVVSFAFGDRE